MCVKCLIPALYCVCKENYCNNHTLEHPCRRKETSRSSSSTLKIPSWVFYLLLGLAAGVLFVLYQCCKECCCEESCKNAKYVTVEMRETVAITA